MVELSKNGAALSDISGGVLIDTADDSQVRHLGRVCDRSDRSRTPSGVGMNRRSSAFARRARRFAVNANASDQPRPQTDPNVAPSGSTGLPFIGMIALSLSAACADVAGAKDPAEKWCSRCSAGAYSRVHVVESVSSACDT